MRSIRHYPKSLWVLAIGMMINVSGASFLWPLNTIYISQELGRSVAVAGIVLMLHGGAGIIGNLLGGNLYDRLGGKGTILMGISMATCSVLVLAFLRDWPIYVGIMIFLGFSKGMIFPAMYAMAGGVWPEGGRKAFNVIYVSQNLGVAVGAALGGMVAQVSFTLVFLVNGAIYLFFMAIIWFGLSDRLAAQPRGEGKDETLKHEKKIPSYMAKRGFISLFILSFGFMACWISYVQWQTTISVYMQELGFSLSSYSLLWTINGFLIILSQPFRSFIIERVLTSLRAQILTGVVIYITAFFILSTQQVYTGFVIAMIIMTIGEIFIWPGVPAAAQELAPAGRKGFYQGVVGSAAASGRMLGPLTGGLLYDIFHPQMMFFGMMAFCTFAFVCFLVYEKAPLFIHR